MKQSPLIKIFPGWGMPLELYRPYSPDYILDFGFFHGEKGADNIIEVDPAKPGKIISDEPSLIIAHSLGTLSALRTAQVSKNVKALIILGGFAKFTSSKPDYPDGKPESGIIMMQNMMKLSPKMVLNRFYSAAIAPSDFSIAPAGKPDTSRLKSGLQCLLDTDLRKLLKDINIPVLILHGEKDQIVSVKLAEFLAENIPDTKLHIFENAGHALPFTHTEQCLELINEFY